MSETETETRSRGRFNTTLLHEGTFSGMLAEDLKSSFQINTEFTDKMGVHNAAKAYIEVK